jgi:hypothetical protein
MELALAEIQLTTSISFVNSPDGLSDWSGGKVIARPFDLK